MAWMGWVVHWVLTDVLAWGDDGSRLQVFDTFKEAVGHGRYIAPLEGVTKVKVQYVVHDMCQLMECDLCWEIQSHGAEPEAPACGVCDGLGHDMYNCRAGDAPGGYSVEELDRENGYRMFGV